MSHISRNRKSTQKLATVFRPSKLIGRHVEHVVALRLLFFDSARLREPQDGLFTGQIDAVDTANFSYRVTFDRPGLWIGILRCHDGDDNENVKNVIGWIGKTTTLHVQHAFFCTFLCRHCTTTTWKCLISRFMEERATTKFFFSLWTWIW